MKVDARPAYEAQARAVSAAIERIDWLAEGERRATKLRKEIGDLMTEIVSVDAKKDQLARLRHSLDVLETALRTHPCQVHMMAPAKPPKKKGRKR